MESAQETLDQMELEVKSHSGPQKAKLNTRLRHLKSDLDKLHGDFRKAKSALHSDLGAAKADLFAGYGEDPELASMDQRTRLLASTDRQMESSRRLEAAKRTAAETEEIGASILADLSTQRGTIMRAKDHVRVADDNVGRSTRVIRSMQRRVATDRLIQMFMILILLTTIGIILYYSFLA